jgi:NAD(P)H dehydrogenase (quinone)
LNILSTLSFAHRATQPKEAMKHIPVITSEIRKDVIKSADAILFGSPTRFGVMTAQMKSFFDALGGLWFENACVGKVASCFTGSGCQHGGQETTLFSMITPLLHLGFIVVGLPYSCKEQKEINEISGGTPYGATFIAGSDGSRAVSHNERACARYQGRHVAQIAKELKLGREALARLSATSPLPVSVPSGQVKPSADGVGHKNAERDEGGTASGSEKDGTKKADKDGAEKGGEKKVGDGGKRSEASKKADGGKKSGGEGKGERGKKKEKKPGDKKGEKKKKTKT